MTLIVALSVSAAAVAVAAAVRSTWSPCGLSMLSTITPLGERGRGRRYRATAWWFVCGAVLGGLCLGACMAALAAAVGALHPSGHDAALVIAVVGSVSAAASDAKVRWLGLPVHRRQVNETWLDQFRPWVYGMGFGWQIGVGLATYITTAGVYLLVVLGSLTGEPAMALALGALFGSVRGLAVFLGRGITTPAALQGFHRRLAAAGPVADGAVIAVELAAAVALAALIGWPAGLGIGAVVLSVAAARRTPRHRRLRQGAGAGAHS